MEALREASSIEAFGTVVAIVGGCCALQRHDRSKMESMVKEFLKVPNRVLKQREKLVLKLMQNSE